MVYFSGMRGVPIRPAQTSPAHLQRWLDRRKMVGSRIREIRMAQGLTQMSLALEAGLSRNMVIGIEWGEKSVAYERLWDIADVLGVTILDLLSGDPWEPSGNSRSGESTTGKTED